MAADATFGLRKDFARSRRLLVPQSCATQPPTPWFRPEKRRVTSTFKADSQCSRSSNMFCIRHAYSLPTRFLSCLFALAVSALFATAAHAQATVSDDAFVNSNTPTANYGSGLALSVGSSSRSFIKFDLSGLPEGIRAE